MKRMVPVINNMYAANVKCTKAVYRALVPPAEQRWQTSESGC